MYRHDSSDSENSPRALRNGRDPRAPAPPGVDAESQPASKALALQRAIGNRAFSSLVTAARDPGRIVVQRAWRRVPRRSFTRLAEVGDFTAAILVHVDMVGSPPVVARVFAQFAGKQTVLYTKPGAYWTATYNPQNADTLLADVERDAPAVVLPPAVRTHIFEGERAGKSHTGLHTRVKLTDQDRVLASTQPDPKGVYAALVLLKDDTVAKASLMFPASWDEHDISEAIREAVRSVQPAQMGVRFGYSAPQHRGFKIGLRATQTPPSLQTLTTAFPLEYEGEVRSENELKSLFPQWAELEAAAVKERLAQV